MKQGAAQFVTAATVHLLQYPDILSTMKVDMEERFCSKVKELGCTCITISHRPALVAFHDLVLALDGEGGWSIHEGATGSFTEEAVSEEGAGAIGGSNGEGTVKKARGMRVSTMCHCLVRAVILALSQYIFTSVPGVLLTCGRLQVWLVWSDVSRNS